ncbi:MAG: hypothetical protein ABIJ96_14770 [Elusimicrobiota bacterium]
MPLYRALLLLCLVPALVFGAEPPAEQLKKSADLFAPATTESFQDFSAYRDSFRLLGYAVDPESKRLLTPDGKELTVGKLQSFFQPFSISEEGFDSLQRNQLYGAGYRIDDAAGVVLSPQTKKPVTRFEMMLLRRQIQLAVKHAALERLNHLLAGQDPDKPLSKDAMSQVRQLIAGREKDLPKALLDALQGARTLKAAAVQQAAESAYTDSTRFFDGFTSLTKQAGAALPVMGEWNAPQKVPGYFDSEEAKLGRAFGKDFSKLLDGNSFGRELYRGLRGNEGKTRFPGFIIINSNAGDDSGYGGAYATYNPSNDKIQFELMVLRSKLLQLTPEKDHAKLAKQLAGPRRMMRYLNNNPQVRRDLADALIVPTVHELTHALQQRRDALSVEINRGNAAGAIPIEWEHEANLSEVRFMHAELLRNPGAAVRREEFYEYLSTLTDFDAYRDGITRTYLTQFPQFAATLPTMKKLQQQRLSVAERLMGEGAYQYVAQTLKRWGLGRGSAAVEEQKTAHARRMEKFTDEEYPRMRQDGYGSLAEHYRKQGRPDKEMKILHGWSAALGAGAPPDTPQRIASAAKSTVGWLTSRRTQDEVSGADRAWAVQNLNAHYGGSIPWPEGVDQNAVYSDIYGDAAEEFLAKARTAVNELWRRHYLESVEAYLKGVGDMPRAMQIKKEIAALRGVKAGAAK